MALVVFFGALAVLILLFFSWGSNSSKGKETNRDSSTSDSETQGAPESASTPTEDMRPQASGETLHPRDLIGNPFRDKGKLVTLDNLPIPVTYQGSVMTYETVDPSIARQVGMKGLRFNRMLAEDIALYDIVSVPAGGGRETDLIGQLAVNIKVGDQPPDDTRPWQVEPLGNLEGTNGFGAPISIPSVKFWGYFQPAAAPIASSEPVVTRPMSDPEPNVNESVAVNLVKDQLEPTPTSKRLHVSLLGVHWSAIENPGSCGQGFWYVEARFDIFQDPQNPTETSAGWCVHIENKVVRPNPTALKYFSTTPDPN